MIVLKTTNLSQSISIIPRRYSDVVFLRVTDESENTSVEYPLLNTTKTNDYLIIDNSYSLVEGRFYKLDIFENNDMGDLIYKDKIFCTDQTINQNTNSYYSINKDEYIEEESNNEFIIIE